MTRVFPDQSTGDDMAAALSSEVEAEAEAARPGSGRRTPRSEADENPPTETSSAAGELSDTFGPLNSSLSKRLDSVNAMKKNLATSLYTAAPSTTDSPTRKVLPAIKSDSKDKDGGDLLAASSSEVVVGPRRDEQVTIEVRIVFLKVGEIDSQKDRFAADVFIHSKWQEPAFDGKQSLTANSEEINWDQYWNPKLSIQNGFGDLKETVWRTVSYDRNGVATVNEKRRINGSFTEFMELNEFPFDSQDLTVTLTSDLDESEVELLEDRHDRCGVNVESFVDAQEWLLHSYLRVWNSIREDDSQHDIVRHPSFSAACKASRKPQFFIWNVLVVMFMICGLSFATFVVNSDTPHFRLTLTLILLLTTISFKFAVNQSLPMISYLTYLDKYILGLMGILTCICVWHAIIGKLVLQCVNSGQGTTTYCRTSYANYDYISLGVLLFCYVLFHVVFIARIRYIQYEKNAESEQFSGVISVPMNSRTNLMEMDDELDDVGYIPDMRKRRNDHANNAIDASNQQQQTVLVA